MKYVTDGTAELRVLEVPRLPRADGTMQDPAEYASISTTPGTQKLILNVPAGREELKAEDLLEQGQTTADLKKPQGFTLRENSKIAGSYVQPVKGSGGSAVTLKVTEGMWEEKLGRKIHGGERRRAMVLHNLRVEEGRKARR